jgi:hypothetical protein
MAANNYYYYNYLAPNVSEIGYNDGAARPYQPVFCRDQLEFFGPSFYLPNNVEMNVASLTELFLPDDLLDDWVKSTLAYAASRIPKNKR